MNKLTYYRKDGVDIIMRWLVSTIKIDVSTFFHRALLASSLMITSILLSQYLILHITSNGMDALRVSFASLPILLGSILLGPLWGALIGGGGDLLAFLIYSQGEYVFFITLVSALRGLLPGLLVRVTGDSKRIRNLALVVALSQLLCSVLFMSLILYISYGIPLLDSLLTRLLIQFFTIPIYMAIIYMILKQWATIKGLKDRERRGEIQRRTLARLALDGSMGRGEMLEYFHRITREVSEALSVERASIWLFSKDHRDLRCLSLYEYGKEEHTQGEVLEVDLFPNYFKALHEEILIDADQAQVDPRTEELNKSYLLPLGITSILDAAIMNEGSLSGVVCLEDMGRRREWYPDEKSFVSTVASMIGQLLANREYREAAKETAQAHQSLGAILDSIDALIYVADLKTYELLFVNKHAQSLWGDVVGERCWEVLQKDQDRPCAFCTNDQLLDAHGLPKGILKWEFQNTKNGRWYECHDTALHWIHGEMVRLELATDITEHKKLEKVLKDKLKIERLLSHLSSMFINLPSEEIDQGIYDTLRETGELFEVDGSFMIHDSSNGSLRDIYEWTQEGIEPRTPIMESISLHSIPLVLERIKEKGTIIIPSREDVPQKREGERDVLKTFSFESVLAVPMVSMNRLLGYMGFFSVNEEKEWDEEHISMLQVVAEIVSSAIVRQDSKRALLESESRFRQMADNIEEVFWLISADTRKLLYVNRAYESVWGLSREDLYQDFLQALLNSIVEEDKHVFREAMENLLEEKIWSLEYRILHPDGSLYWIYTRIFSVHNDEGRIVGHAGISVDITKLKDSQHEALQASRAKSEFLSVISHELRTPLHAILSYADLGLEESKELESRELEDFLNKIQISSNRLLYLINDLLDISRIEAGSLTYTFMKGDLYEMVLSSSSELSTLLESKEIELLVVKPGFPVSVNIDHHRMMQVLRNLIHNAIKFSPRGSSIKVHFTKEESTGSFLSTHITDEGPGIPEEELESIFNKFTQSRKAMYREKGTGLGLAICKEIIKAHGGKIDADNEPEGGACLTFTLPLKD